MILWEMDGISSFFFRKTSGSQNLHFGFRGNILVCANAISQARHKKCGNIDPTKIVHELRICGKKSPIKTAVLIFGCLFFLGCWFVFSTSCKKKLQKS